MKPTKDLRPLLRRLANLLAETSECLTDLVDSYDQAAEPETSPTAPSLTTSQPWSWDSVVELSVALLDEVPDRVWRWDEFCVLLRARGVHLDSWRGVNGRLMAELKKRALIEPDGKSTFRRSRGEAPGIAGSKPASIPWEDLVRVAKHVLQDQGGKRWTGSELCQALRDRGVTMPSWRGVPFGLVGRLHTQRVVERSNRDGTFVVLERDEGPHTHAQPDSSPARRRVAERSPSAKRRVVPVETSVHEHPPIPWDELVQQSEHVLANHEGEDWTASALCQELRQRVTLKSWKSVPFGLVWKLHARRVVEARRDGSFVVLARRSQTSTPPPEPSEPPAAVHDASQSRPPIVDPEDSDDVHGLVEEIDAVASYLSELPHRQVTSQICLWAGRARRIKDTLGNRPPDIAAALKDALKTIFRRLLELTHKHNPGWVDALSSEWSTDWNVYIAYHQAIVGGYEPELSHEEEQTYHRDILRGLFIGHRKVNRAHAHRVMLEALPLLTEGDVVASKAIRMFGRPPERRVVSKGPPPHQRRSDRPLAPPEPWPEVRRDLPEDVLALTRGKRMLIAGGQGARDAHRAAIRDSFGLAEIEWVTTERGKGSPFNRLEERMRPGRYDLVLFLVSHSSHQSGGFVKACKDAQIPLVFLPRGYSVTSVAQAISQQLLAKRTPEWMQTSVPAN